MMYIIEAETDFNTFRKIRSLYRNTYYNNNILKAKVDYPDMVANLISLLKSFNSSKITVKYL